MDQPLPSLQGSLERARRATQQRIQAVGPGQDPAWDVRFPERGAPGERGLLEPSPLVLKGSLG
jgi:hypothetical protein